MVDSGLGLLMDEEMQEIDLGELYLVGIEDTYDRKSYESIFSRQIQLLQKALAKPKSQNNLEIYNPPQKDKQKY